MITSVHIENFKCFKEFDIELGKFNVLVGPNGAGKTSFLQAIGLASIALEVGGQKHPSLSQFVGPLELSLGEHLAWRGEPSMRIVLRSEKDGRPDCAVVVKSVDGETFYCGEEAHLTDRKTGRSLCPPMGEDDRRRCAEEFGSVGYHKFDPRLLKQPNRLSAEWANLQPNGEGLANLLNFLLGQDRKLFEQLERAFCERFPEYTGLVVEPQKLKESEVGLALRFRTAHGQVLPSEAVSDGTILSLAFLAVTHVSNPPGILLVEEPEKGIHHVSLKLVVGTLQELAEKKNVQVILTTHSPFLLDWVEGSDVRVFAKTDDGGVRCAKLADHPDVEKWKKHFMSGEIWTGLDEADVVAHHGGAK